MINKEKINSNCIFFNGYKPCKFHKQEGVHCLNCVHYHQVNKNILIIKLGAAGEIIRTTPIIHKINEKFPNSKIFWLTKTTELIPKKENIKVLDYSLESLTFLRNMEFDIIFSLDKDLDACSLANEIKADIKKGFSQKKGVILPFDQDCTHKWKTGIFDDLMKKNKKHYVEEIFEICGFKWMGEEYIPPEYSIPEIKLNKNKKIIGVQTGTGQIWNTRTFSKDKMISLIKLLTKKYEVVLLGGPDEEKLNNEISKKTNTKHFNVLPREKFIGLISLMDLVITPVTFVLHVSIALNKKIVLLNNIFPTNEFHLYGLGVTLEPEVPCKKCYKTKFNENCVQKYCLDLIENNEILDAVQNLIG